MRRANISESSLVDIRIVRRLPTAAVIAMGVLAVATLGSATVPPAWAEVQCTGQQGPNPAKPESYREQYSSTVFAPLKRDLARYQSAAASDDPDQTGRAATSLYSEIQTDLAMFTDQTWFGCYDPVVLTGVKQAADAFTSTLDDISAAAAGFSGKTPDDVPALVAQAQPQQTAYISALNAYAAQFGGEQIAQP